MKDFTMEERQLFNSFMEDPTDGAVTKESLLKRVESAKMYTDDPELVELANSFSEKLQGMSVEEFDDLLKAAPLEALS